MKTIMKFLVISAILLMTSCLSDVQKQVKKEYGLDKIMCGYAWNKNKSEVIIDEIEARIDRQIVILKDIKAGKTDYIAKQYEITTLFSEIKQLSQNPCFQIYNDTSPQMGRIRSKLEQIQMYL